MAKICIFNTQVDKDTAQEPFESVVPVPPIVSYTKPVRLMNTRICSFEFIYSSSSAKQAEPAPEGGMEFTLYWWREFWGDDVPGSLQNPPPDKRVLAAVYPDTPWSREAGYVESPAGVIANAPATRVSRLSMREGEYGAALWVTTKVHAPWVRLAVQANAPGIGDGQLLINAHVAGHSEVKELDAHGDIPYAYKFVGTQT